MSQKVIALVVTLDQPYTSEDVARIVDAVEMVKGVLTVEDTVTQTYEYHSARTQVRAELTTKLLGVLSD